MTKKTEAYMDSSDAKPVQVDGTSIKQALQSYVAGYPDVAALVASGKLIAKGGGWYETSTHSVLTELGAYAYSNGVPKIVNGKARVKLRQLREGLVDRVSKL